MIVELVVVVISVAVFIQKHVLLKCVAEEKEQKGKVGGREGEREVGGSL